MYWAAFVFTKDKVCRHTSNLDRARNGPRGTSLIGRMPAMRSIPQREGIWNGRMRTIFIGVWRIWGYGGKKGYAGHVQY